MATKMLAIIMNAKQISNERGNRMQNKELYVFLRAMQELHTSKNYDAIGRVLSDGIKELETVVKKSKSSESDTKEDSA